MSSSSCGLGRDCIHHTLLARSIRHSHKKIFFSNRCIPTNDIWKCEFPRPFMIMEASRERKMMQVHLRLWNHVPQTGLFASSVWMKFLEDSHRWFHQLGGYSKITLRHVAGSKYNIYPTGVVGLRRESIFQNRIIEQVRF